MFLVFTLNPALGIFYFVSPNFSLLPLFFLGSSDGAFSSSISNLVVFLFSIVFHYPLLLFPVLHPVTHPLPLYLNSKSFFFNSKSSNSSHNSSKLLKSINISFLNIRSLNNESIYVFNLLSDSNLDFLALSKIWHKHASSPSFSPACPPSYSFLELTRASQNPLFTTFSTYRGICFFLNLPLPPPRLHPDFKSFESFVSSSKYGTLTLFIAVIYRPPSSFSSFINDFAALLKFLYTLFSLFYIVVEFNVQFNNKINFYTKKFLELFNHSQHCHFSSHSSGNTIDLFITSTFIKPISILAHPISFSDHHLIQSSFPTNPIKLSSIVKVSTRSWSQLDKTLFIQAYGAFLINNEKLRS